MNDHPIHIAFALSKKGTHESKHFGEADKFAIFLWQNNELVFRSEIQNPLKNFDEAQPHGDQKKGQGIIELLKAQKVNVVVSKQFGKNIRMINQHFLPVIAHGDTPSEVFPTLQEHAEWLTSELRKSPSQYDLLI